ncbi:unnamed protein product, partial [Bubo scandiacus]
NCLQLLTTRNRVLMILGRKLRKCLAYLQWVIWASNQYAVSASEVQANKCNKYFGHVFNRMLKLEKSSYYSQRRAERLMKTKCMMTVENRHEGKKLTENICK